MRSRASRRRATHLREGLNIVRLELEILHTGAVFDIDAGLLGDAPLRAEVAQTARIGAAVVLAHDQR